jgi:hypothetical protein
MEQSRSLIATLFQELLNELIFKDPPRSLIATLFQELLNELIFKDPPRSLSAIASARHTDEQMF